MKKYIFILVFMCCSFGVALVAHAASCPEAWDPFKDKYCGQDTRCWYNYLGDAALSDGTVNVGVNAVGTCYNWGCNLVKASLRIDWGDGSPSHSVLPSWGGAAWGGQHNYTSSGRYSSVNYCTFEIYTDDFGYPVQIAERQLASWISFSVTVATPTPEAAGFHLECVNNTCTEAPGDGVDACVGVDTACDLPPEPVPVPVGEKPNATITNVTAAGTRLTSTAKAPGTIAGTATSSSATITGVQVAIRRVLDTANPNTCGAASANFDWNGSAWVKGCVPLTAAIAGPNRTRTWTYANTPPIASLTPGETYRVYVNAIDEFGDMTSWKLWQDAVYTEIPTPTPTPTPSATPTANNASMTAPDYCAVGPGAVVSWTYAPGTGTQKAYQVQIDDAPYDFTAPVVDSGTVTSTTQLYSSALSFNTLYRARVKVMDQSDAWGDWSATSAVFATPVHACPQVDFSVDPAQPPAEQKAQFTDETLYDPVSFNQSWLWNFGDGMGASTLQNPSYTYMSDGARTVTLQVSDDACTCKTTKNLNVQHRLPTWKEVQPK